MINTRKAQYGSAGKELLDMNMMPAAPASISFDTNFKEEIFDDLASEQSDENVVQELDELGFPIHELGEESDDFRYRLLETPPPLKSKIKVVVKKELSAVKIVKELGIGLMKPVAAQVGENLSQMFSSNSNSKVSKYSGIMIPNDSTYQFTGDNGKGVENPDDNRGVYHSLGSPGK